MYTQNGIADFASETSPVECRPSACDAKFNVSLECSGHNGLLAVHACKALADKKVHAVRFEQEVINRRLLSPCQMQEPIISTQGVQAREHPIENAARFVLQDSLCE